MTQAVFAPTLLAAILAASLQPTGGNAPVFTAQAAADGFVTVQSAPPSLQPNTGPSISGYTYPFAATNSPTVWSVVSGTLPPGLALTTAGVLKGLPSAIGTYTFTIGAGNAYGTAISSPQTIHIGYRPEIPQQPIVGVPLYAVVPGISESIMGYQWYANVGDGTGPIAISGATANPYVPAAGDTSKWLSVAVTTASGTWRSGEFTLQGVAVSQTAVGVMASPSTNLNGVTDIGHGYTFPGMTEVRLVNGTKYIDSVMAPGTAAGKAKFGDAGQSNDYGTYFFAKKAVAPGAVMAPLAQPPATSTRPSANTGSACFVSGNGFYDNTGARVKIRGVNKYAPGTSTAGYLNTGANACRFWLGFDTTNAFSVNNGSNIDAMIAKKMIPIITMGGSRVNFKATCDGTNVITITQMTNVGGIGYLYLGATINADTGSGFKACTITAFGGGSGTAGTGKTGQYTVSLAQPVISSAVALVCGDKSSGSSSLNLILALAQTWAELYPLLQPYDTRMVMCPANELGAQGSATNTGWRDGYVQFISIVRAAGYTCPIMIDAPGSGQDGGFAGNLYTMMHHAAAVLASDPLANTMFDVHVYGQWHINGNWPITAMNLGAYGAANGVCFLVGEFGPGRNTDTLYNSGGVQTPEETMGATEAAGLAGWLAWAWDDHLFSAAPEQDNWYSLAYDIYNGYKTTPPLSSDLTIFGHQVIEHPTLGTNQSIKAPMFG